MKCVPYASVVGSLMHAIFCTRPYISNAVGVLSRYMSTPGKENWIAIKRVLRYLHGTPLSAICYQGKLEIDKEVNVHGFVDADWAIYLDRRRSTCGYVFRIFSGEINWMSKRHVVVSF
jgi:hypothetical protein